MSEVAQEQPVIVVDIDGVLFDTPKQAIERWNEIHGTTHAVTDIYDHDAVHDKVKFRHYHDDGKYDEDNGQGKFDDGFYDGQKEVDGYIQMEGARDALSTNTSFGNGISPDFDNLVTVKQYDTDSLRAVIGAFIDENKIHKKDMRLNFFINPEINAYLKHQAHITGKNKSEILRDLILREIGKRPFIAKPYRI